MTAIYRECAVYASYMDWIRDQVIVVPHAISYKDFHLVNPSPLNYRDGPGCSSMTAETLVKKRNWPFPGLGLLILVLHFALNSLRPSVGKLTIMDSDNGLSPGRRQAIIWTNAGILLTRTSGISFSEILSEIHTVSFKKMHLKMPSAKWRQFCLGLSVLRDNSDFAKSTCWTFGTLEKLPPLTRPTKIHYFMSLQWRHNEHDGVSNHQPHDCFLNRLFGRTSKKTSKLHVTGLCEENSPVTGEFPVQRASNAENVSILWRHHVFEISSRWFLPCK